MLCWRLTPSSASVATLIRLKYIIELADISDVLCKSLLRTLLFRLWLTVVGNGTTAMVWTLVEPGVAITAASLVTMRPLLRTLKFPGFESGMSGPAAHTPLTLRNDISGGHWSTISSQQIDNKSRFEMPQLHRLASSNGLEGVDAHDTSREEMELEGITRTVQVRVVHDRASRVIDP